MKKIITIVFILALVSIKVHSQKNKQIDTIYIKANIDDLNNKFNFINSTTSINFSIIFFYNIKWKIYGTNEQYLGFNYKFYPNPPNDWLSQILDDKKIAKLKTVYTLRKLTNKLSKTSLKYNLNRKQFILLYGAKGSKKFEAFPVKINTASWNIPKSTN